VTDWISGAEAAEILGVSPSTVYRSLADPGQRAEQWGTEGDGWRHKPLSRRRVYQVSRQRAEAIAAGGDPLGDADGAPASHPGG
jgi:hypothetical protein